MEFPYDRENILIYGGVGSGKTTVCKMLIEHYCDAPYFVYTFVINCRTLRGNIAISRFRPINAISCDVPSNFNFCRTIKYEEL